MSSVPSGRPAEGLVVLEVAHMLSGPTAGQILSQLGATVVKVEMPGGDVTHRLGPRGLTDSAMFVAANNSKHLLTLDLATEAGADQFSELVSRADIMITNLAEGLLSSRGLDAATLRARFPQLVFVGLKGTADGGRSTDGLAQAISGLMSMTGAPDGPCYRTGASVVDVVAGLWAAFGAVAAIRQRGITGAGSEVEVVLDDVARHLQFAQLAMYGADPEVVVRNGNHSMIACTPTLETADGLVCVTILNDRHWQAICTVVGRADLIEDPRFDCNEARQRNQAEIEIELRSELIVEERLTWCNRLQAAGLPVAPVLGYDEVLADEELRKRGVVSVLPEEPSVPLVNIPVRPYDTVPESRVRAWQHLTVEDVLQVLPLAHGRGEKAPDADN